METSVLEALLEELVDIALHENEEHDERQDIFDVQAQPLREHEALAGVRFGDEIVPSPAAFVAAEERNTIEPRGSRLLLTMKSSRSRIMEPGPKGWMPDSTLKPRAQGRESRKTRTKLTVTAFLRVHLSTSMP